MVNWKMSRTFCGKLQDYPKNLRTWRTFDPWVLVNFRSKWRHHRRGSLNFFALKFNIIGPCSNLVLTERERHIDLTPSEFLGKNECTFRVHLPYGYNVRLSVHLLSVDDSLWPDNELSESISQEWLLKNGQCPVAVQAEDVKGRKTFCLHQQHPKEILSSATNVLKFQIVLLQALTKGIFLRQSITIC